MAVAFDHELHMASTMAAPSIDLIVNDQVANKLHGIAESLAKTNIPLLLKFAGRLNRFDPITATTVLIAVSRIMQAKMNKPPADFTGLTRDRLEKSVEAARNMAAQIFSDSTQARTASRPYFPPEVTVGPPAPSPASP